MLVDEVARIDATNLLREDDFSLDSHRLIYKAILAVMGTSMVPDLTTVADELKRRKSLDAVGSLPYLYELSEGLPRKLSVGSYAHIVREKSTLRQLMSTFDAGMMEAADESEDSAPIIDRTIATLQAIREETEEGGLIHVGETLTGRDEPSDLAEEMAARDGIKLGWTQWDEHTGGIQPGSLVVVAARPSMGKTAWMCCAAHHAAVVQHKVTAVFTLEQDRKAIHRRMLAQAARIDYQDILKGTLRPYDRTLLRERDEILRAAPLYIDDQPGLTVSRIRARCLRLQNSVGADRQPIGLDIVFVDQLSHVDDADVFQRGMLKHQAVGKQTKAFKRMGKELGVPVVLFNQLSRESTKRTDSRPTLGDLKESGNIEEDADVVAFLHRPEYYDKSNEDLRGKGEMILAKQREGPTAICDCLYQGRMMRWEDEQQPAAEQRGFESGRW